nr:hypothetical protein [Escherichia coli]
MGNTNSDVIRQQALRLVVRKSLTPCMLSRSESCLFSKELTK